MRVTLKHEEVRKGLTFKRHYAVYVKVEFTEAEKFVIKEQRLGRFVVVERGPPSHIPNGHPDRFHLQVKHLAKGDKYLCPTLADAKNYEDELISQLELLKRVLDRSEENREDRTFEL